jgi:hypothetical protein
MTTQINLLKHVNLSICDVVSQYFHFHIKCALFLFFIMYKCKLPPPPCLLLQVHVSMLHGHRTQYSH